MMRESRISGWPRLAVLLAVVSLHAGLLALLIAASRTPLAAPQVPAAIEVIALPTIKAPQVRIENLHPEPPSTRLLTALAPPSIDGAALTGGAPEGHGAAVNWAAEAHRAVRAYEIRRDQPQTGAWSFSTYHDWWWPQRTPRAGDAVKTENGDWIVWIDANCYQVAAWHAGAAAQGLHTVCRAESGEPPEAGREPPPGP